MPCPLGFPNTEAQTHRGRVSSQKDQVWVLLVKTEIVEFVPCFGFSRVHLHATSSYLEWVSKTKENNNQTFL